MYQHILVPLDGSALAEQVLPHAQALAHLDAPTRLTLLRAVPPIYATTVEFGGVYAGATSPIDEMATAEHNARTYLEDIATVLRTEGFHVDTEVSRLTAAEAIVDFAEHHKVDLITIATHGRSGIGRWVFGSVTQKVMQVSPVPVLVIRPQQQT